MIHFRTNKDQPCYLLIITNRLSKEAIFEVIKITDAKACDKRFLNSLRHFHGFLRAIKPNCRKSWVGYFWRRLCEKAGIEQ